jgi:hypothetical protein
VCSSCALAAHRRAPGWKGRSKGFSAKRWPRPAGAPDAPAAYRAPRRALAPQETLLGRLDALLPKSKDVSLCQTGSNSGLCFSASSAALASDGAVSLVIMGDVNLMEEEAADGLTDREARAAARAPTVRVSGPLLRQLSKKCTSSA